MQPFRTVAFTLRIYAIFILNIGTIRFEREKTGSKTRREMLTDAF